MHWPVLSALSTGARETPQVTQGDRSHLETDLEAALKTQHGSIQRCGQSPHEV